MAYDCCTTLFTMCNQEKNYKEISKIKYTHIYLPLHTSYKISCELQHFLSSRLLHPQTTLYCYCFSFSFHKLVYHFSISSKCLADWALHSLTVSNSLCPYKYMQIKVITKFRVNHITPLPVLDTLTKHKFGALESNTQPYEWYKNISVTSQYILT